MNDRHRRVERLRVKCETPEHKLARHITQAMGKVGQTIGEVSEILKKNQNIIIKAANALKKEAE